MTVPLTEDKQPLRNHSYTVRLEKRIVRAALACLDRNGWMFQTDQMRGDYVIKPMAMRKLENACAALKKARRKR